MITRAETLSPFNMFYYIDLKYGNFLLEILDTFPLLKDAYTHSRKYYEHWISSWYGALQQIRNFVRFLLNSELLKSNSEFRRNIKER
jgi:hypothetical protein